MDTVMLPLVWCSQSLGTRTQLLVGTFPCLGKTEPPVCASS